MREKPQSDIRKNDIPTQFVIFGATGDLAQRKIYPALFDLFTKGALPKKFSLAAFGRRDLTDKSYRSFVKAALVQKKGETSEKVEKFLELIKYTKGVFEKPESYQVLAKKIEATDKSFNVCTNKLFYLAIPPSLYELVLQKLSESGLSIPCGTDGGWTRVLIEKPFGKDIETARRLDKMLGTLFEESQIFRIDHYLAKETLQNILAFRFANALFEPIWNRKHIERIEVRMFEVGGVGSRGSLYDGLGALRDVGQNHLLAMLSLITMVYPSDPSATTLRKERARILKQLVPITGATLRRRVSRGQYEGYSSEAGVLPGSLTETFFNITAELKSRRWKGVPIELTAGKAMNETNTEINLYFKDVDSGKRDVDSNRNLLTFRIQPNEGISLVFWVKKPGFTINDTYPKTLSFNYADSIDTKLIPDAYERVLYDCIRGDQTLFASTEEVEAAWKFVSPILEKWSRIPLHAYRPGSSLQTILKKK